MEISIYNIPTSSRSLFLTYHALDGIPPGRSEEANSVIYSGIGVKSHYGAEIFEGPQARTLKQSFYKDLLEVRTIYLYIGTPPLEHAKELLLKFLDLRKQVLVIACDCADNEKEELKKLSHRWEWTTNKCGGEEEMLHILKAIEKDNKKGAG